MGVFSLKINYEKLNELIRALQLETRADEVIAKFKIVAALPAATFLKPEGFKVIGELVEVVGLAIQESGSDYKTFIQDKAVRREIGKLIDGVLECSAFVEPFDGMFINMSLDLVAGRLGG